MIFNAITEIFSNVTGFIKNLNLTKENVLAIIVVLMLVGTSWSAIHFKNKSVQLQTALTTSETERQVERDEAKENNNIEKMKKLQTEVNGKNKELVVLYRKLEKLQSIQISYQSIMEGFGNVEDTEGVCHMFADLGYPICGKLEIIRRD